jgi:tRNA pseudouridine55 synthase
VNGWIVIDKPVGPGSTDVVTAVKRALRAGGYPKVKVGHGGTLDPLASGVLPVALGEATKLAGRLLDSDKVYQFTVQFGEETATLDAEGQVVATSDVRPSAAALAAVLPRFTGAIDQVPPAFSALKVDGARAYDLARAGEAVVLATRAVTVRSLHSSPAGGGGDEATLIAHVSKGTYIRSLARDIARALGTVGHVTYLRRVNAGPFGLDRAITLDKLAELGHARALEQILLPLRTGLDDIPAFALSPDQAGSLRQGRVLAGIAAADGSYLAELDAVPVALVEVEARQMRVVRGFNL